MTVDDKIKDEKIKYDINRETAKKSILSSEKVDNYKYLNRWRNISIWSK